MRGRSRWPCLLVSTLIVATLASPLPARAQGSGTADTGGVDPASEPYTKPDTADPPTAEERLPVIDLSELPGLWPEDVVEAFPGQRDPVSPSDAIEGATRLAAKGDATMDVFGVGEGSAEHLALIEAEPKNERGANGDWSDRELALEAVTGGWTWTDLAGVVFTFPAVLSPETPLVVEAADGILTIVPSDSLPGGIDGATPAQVSSAGIVQGASVTYPGAVDGHDLVYIVTPLGVQEQIIFAKAPGTATFRFTVTTKGLSLEPNPYGGLDVTASDGAPVGTIPAEP